MILLKQSTAATVVTGPFLDSTDGNTQETALTIAQADIRLSKNGAAFAQTSNVAGATHMEKGNYSVPLDTTDTGTLGRLRVHIHETGALAVWQDFMVVPANVWDSLFSTDKLQVDVTQCGGSAVAAGAIPNAAADGAGGLPVSDAGGLDLDAKLANTHEVTAARMGALTDWIDAGRLDALLDAIKAKTDNLPADPADDSDIDAQLATIAAYLDTEIAAILEDTNEIQGLIAAGKIAAQVKGMDADVLTASALATDAGDEIADQVADEVYEGTLTLREVIRILLAVLGGKSSGGGTATITFRDNADTKNRVVATVESDGDRTAMTLDGT